MPENLRPGLREELLTTEVERLVERATAVALHAEVTDLTDEEAADRLSRYLGDFVKRAIESVPEREQAAFGAWLTRQLLEELSRRKDGAVTPDDLPIEPGRVLRALLGTLPGGGVETIERPLTPLLDTTVFTNARGEPSVRHELQAEIASAESIDIVIAFIRYSGIAPLLDALRRHCATGKSIRVLTTTYTNSTEARALDALVELGAEVRVSYDVSSTRLHAKAWIFHRGNTYSTAYVGSSNLTHMAQVTGLEWNVRLSGARNPDAVAKVAAVCESYWHSGDFVPYDAEVFMRQTAVADENETFELPFFDIEPRPFQQRLLELLAVSRRNGHTKNLLVAATGTGKTVMSALDYANLRSSVGRSRLLFIAHRDEILRQSRATFGTVLRDMSFGEMWVGGSRPREFDHVFASIQSLAAAGPESIDPAHFDVVIVDEFHHAAARTYRELLEWLRPRELLGLTATPERSDGLDVLHYFDNRIAAELRVWDAIDQQYLAPFAYYGVYDGLDFREVRWKRGTGYDIDELTTVLTADHLHVRRIVEQLRQKAEDPGAIRALAFCVSVAHARFMAQQFTKLGLPSVAVSADTPREDRGKALRDLNDGHLRVLCAVDLFNEGVDLPNVNTLLLLRPTDSATLFLQQLGRGLRKAAGKPYCLVLDFVGLHRKEFRLDQRFRALLGGSRHHLKRQVEQGFPFLPAGCHLELDRVAQEEVLRSIRESLPSTWRERCSELRSIGDVSLTTYLSETGLDLEDVYAGNHTWTEMRRVARLHTLDAGPEEIPHLRAVGRLLHVDDEERLDAYSRFAALNSPPDASALGGRDRRLLQMLVASLTNRTSKRSFDEALHLIWANPQVRAEVREVVDALRTRVDHVHIPISTPPDVPLQVHARYTRREILAAFSSSLTARAHEWREGVRWERDHDTDVFAFTLDKTSGGFSPTTRYRDYAISRELIHWESQSVTSVASETGRRYIGHRERGGTILLFARLRTDDRAFWCLGPGNYVSHEGDRPIAFTWRLENSLPGDLYAEFAAAAV